MERDGLGFYRYLPVSQRDKDWGVGVYGGGSCVIGPGVPPDPHPPEFQYGWERGRTLLDKYQVLYFAGGSDFELQADGLKETVTLKAGSVLLLMPGVWHRYRTRADRITTHHWAAFGGELADHWQRSGLISRERPVFPHGGGTATIQAFQRLLANLNRSDCGLQHALGACIMDAIGGAVTADDAGRGIQVETLDSIANARRILETNVEQIVDLERLAMACGLSYRRFRYDFSSITGLAPHQYHLLARIERAKTLLENSALPIKEVAAMLRFSDQYHFAKCFKQKAGKTPTEWRRDAISSGAK